MAVVLAARFKKHSSIPASTIKQSTISYRPALPEVDEDLASITALELQSAMETSIHNADFRQGRNGVNGVWWGSHRITKIRPESWGMKVTPRHIT